MAHLEALGGRKMFEKLVEIKDEISSSVEGSKKFVAVKNANLFYQAWEKLSLCWVSLVVVENRRLVAIITWIILVKVKSSLTVIRSMEKSQGNLQIRRIQMIFQDPLQPV